MYCTNIETKITDSRGKAVEFFSCYYRYTYITIRITDKILDTQNKQIELLETIKSNLEEKEDVR